MVPYYRVVHALGLEGLRFRSGTYAPYVAADGGRQASLLWRDRGSGYISSVPVKIDCRSSQTCV